MAIIPSEKCNHETDNLGYYWTRGATAEVDFIIKHAAITSFKQNSLRIKEPHPYSRTNYHWDTVHC